MESSHLSLALHTMSNDPAPQGAHSEPAGTRIEAIKGVGDRADRISKLLS